MVSLMMAIEVAFFLYWEVSVFLVGFGDLDYIIAETSLLLYYNVLILPYLILNRHIHHEFRRIFLCQKNTMTGALWLRRVRNHSTSPCS
uniref:G protein-coupled receptor n=1 Tax=Haemonchus contortus TaxID=6289 RepID=A0A7I4YSX1_HAECO